MVRPGKRGSVIVVVLVTLLLASLMLMKFMESSEVELTLATRQADRERLRTDAYAAMETVLAVMAEVQAINNGLYAPEQGWGDPYLYSGSSPREGVSVKYAFFDETGKASLPKLEFEELVQLVTAIGLNDTDARRFADGLFAWTKADYSPVDMEAEASRYERDMIPHEPPKRSLRSWEELRAVRLAREYVYDEEGALTPFGAALRENVSLYEFDGSNVNSLAPALGAARGWDTTQSATIASYRGGKAARPAGAPPWFRNTKDVTSILGANADTRNIGTEVKIMRVEVTVREGAASMRLGALVAVDDSVALPAVAEGTKTSGSAAGQTQSAAQTSSTPTGTGGTSSQTGTARRTQTGGETASGAQPSEEKLDYPFRILEVVESSGPAPAPPVDEIEETLN
jgi:general secretion pathway protein K